MSKKNWVLLEDLGPRTNWSSIRAKTLQALGKTAEDSIMGGRMDRRRRAGYIEMLDEDLAARVAAELHGYRDKDAEKESRSDLKPWRATVITREEAGVPAPRVRSASGSAEPARRRGGSRGRSRSHSRSRRIRSASSRRSERRRSRSRRR
mmetsp:Transcript_104395/g.261707  ORF Transcript_104395/g.261707 Transcript_104395/m.261707 type:complete len:150 (-) Transcript_104395:10-459(-)